MSHNLIFAKINYKYKIIIFIGCTHFTMQNPYAAKVWVKREGKLLQISLMKSVPNDTYKQLTENVGSATLLWRISWFFPQYMPMEMLLC